MKEEPSESSHSGTVVTVQKVLDNLNPAHRDEGVLLFSPIEFEKVRICHQFQKTVHSPLVINRTLQSQHFSNTLFA